MKTKGYTIVSNGTVYRIKNPDGTVYCKMTLGPPSFEYAWQTKSYLKALKVWAEFENRRMKRATEWVEVSAP